jgi:hypothetical protein
MIIYINDQTLFWRSNIKLDQPNIYLFFVLIIEKQN